MNRYLVWLVLWAVYALGVLVGSTRSPSYSWIEDAGLGFLLLCGVLSLDFWWRAWRDRNGAR